MWTNYELFSNFFFFFDFADLLDFSASNIWILSKKMGPCAIYILKRRLEK